MEQCKGECCLSPSFVGLPEMLVCISDLPQLATTQFSRPALLMLPPLRTGWTRGDRGDEPCAACLFARTALPIESMVSGGGAILFLNLPLLVSFCEKRPLSQGSGCWLMTENVLQHLKERMLSDCAGSGGCAERR